MLQISIIHLQHKYKLIEGITLINNITISIMYYLLLLFNISHYCISYFVSCNVIIINNIIYYYYYITPNRNKREHQMQCNVNDNNYINTITTTNMVSFITS